MQPNHKPDPYKDFKNDDQLRRALNWKSTSDTVRAIGVSVCFGVIALAALDDIRPLLRQLLKLLQ